MSLEKKRPLPLEGDCAEQKKYEKPLACSRPQRPAKRRKTDEPNDVQKLIGSAESKVSAKVKRQVWTASAIDAFSEGLYQHGKNFHRILKYMQTKNKKKNDPVIPNLTKNQVRFFYYRTWHKVSALLMDPPHQPHTAESKKPKSLKVPATGESSPLALGDGRSVEDEVGNPLDSSLEEQEALETSPLPLAKVSSVAEDGEPMLGSPPPVEPEVGYKVKEAMETSPGTANIADKCDGRKDPVKDTVVVNGVKHSLDMVALICYYKLKKKCPGEHNLSKRLSELVYHGTTTIRVKGKRKVQIKIPNCRALQGECKVETGGEPPLVDPILDQNADRAFCEPAPYTPTHGPQQVTVELRPVSTASWLYVQGLAQNPRLRVTMSASKTLSELLQFLVQRWQLRPVGSGDAIHLYCSQATQSREHLPVHPLPPNLGGKESEDGSEDEVAHQSAHLNEPSSQSLSTCDGERRESSPHVAGEDHGKGDEQSACVERSPISRPSTVSTVSNTECVSQSTTSHGDIPMEENRLPCNVFQGDNDAIADGHKSSTESQLVHSTTGEGVHSELVDDSSSDSSIQSRPSRRLSANMTSSLSEIHYKLSRPEKLKLFYEIIGFKANEDCSSQLKAFLKLVEFVGNLEKQSGEASPSPAAFVHMSPKVVEYIRSLPKKSPRKSPLTKYLKLKNRSPLRAGVLVQPPKRVRLDFGSSGSISQTGTDNMVVIPESLRSHPVVSTPPITTTSASQSQAKPPLEGITSLPRPASSETSQSVLQVSSQSPPPLASAGASPTVMTMLQVGQNTPEVVQLSKGGPFKEPRMPVMSVPKDSLHGRGSFSSIELPSIFSAVGERLHQTSSHSLHSLLTSETTISPKSRPGKSRKEGLSPLSRPLWPPGRTFLQKCDNASGKSGAASKTIPAKSQAKLPDIMPPSTSAVENVSTKETSDVTSQAHCSRTQPGAAHLASLSPPVSSLSVRQPTAGPIQSVARPVPVSLDQRSSSVNSSVPVPVSTISMASLPGLRLTSGITSISQVSQPVTHLSAANSTPLPVVTTLKPYSKTARRPKKAQNRPGQTRQLVPRPLLFLPQSGNMPVPSLGQQTQPSTAPTFPVVTSATGSSMTQGQLTLPITPPTSVGSSSPTINGRNVTTSTLQNQLLALTRTLILQQRMQTLQAPQGPASESSANTVSKPTSDPKRIENKADNGGVCTSVPKPKAFPEREISESDIQGALLDNFLLEQSSVQSSGTSRLFHTSSDTVNELLKGLSTTQQDDSIRKLTEETADVLPSFAKALTVAGQSGDKAQPSHTNSGEGTAGTPSPEENVTSVSTSSGVFVESRKNVDRSSQLSFLNENNSLPDDPMFKQLSERCDIFDPLDFPDSMFAQLRDLTKTPEKPALNEGGHGECSPAAVDSELSLGSLLDFLGSPEKEHPKHSSVESTYRSLMEENSVDYIQKFKEMASQMNNRT